MKKDVSYVCYRCRVLMLRGDVAVEFDPQPEGLLSKTFPKCRLLLQIVVLVVCFGLI